MPGDHPTEKVGEIHRHSCAVVNKIAVVVDIVFDLGPLPLFPKIDVYDNCPLMSLEGKCIDFLIKAMKTRNSDQLDKYTRGKNHFYNLCNHRSLREPVVFDVFVKQLMSNARNELAIMDEPPSPTYSLH